MKLVETRPLSQIFAYMPFSLLNLFILQCKYRAEEIEIVAAVRGHSNIIKTLLIVQSNDQMLVFMPKVKCEFSVM